MRSALKFLAFYGVELYWLGSGLGALALAGGFVDSGSQFATCMAYAFFALTQWRLAVINNRLAALREALGSIKVNVDVRMQDQYAIVDQGMLRPGENFVVGPDGMLIGTNRPHYDIRQTARVVHADDEN